MFGFGYELFSSIAFECRILTDSVSLFRIAGSASFFTTADSSTKSDSFRPASRGKPSQSAAKRRERVRKTGRDSERKASEQQISDLRKTVEDLLDRLRRGAEARNVLVLEHNTILDSLRRAVTDKEEERRLTALQLDNALIKAQASHADASKTRDEHHRLQLENVLAKARLDKEESAQREARLRAERDSARTELARVRAHRDSLGSELLALRATSSELAVRAAVANSGALGSRPLKPRPGH